MAVYTGCVVALGAFLVYNSFFGGELESIKEIVVKQDAWTGKAQ